MDQNNQQGSTPSPFFNQTNQAPVAQTPTPQAAQPAPQTVSLPPRKPTHGILIALVVVIVLAAVGGVGAYVYTSQRPEPKEVFRSAILSFKGIKSIGFSADVSGAGTTTPQPGVPISAGIFSFHTDGKVDTHDEKNPKADISLSTKFHSNADNNLVDASVAGEIKVIGDKAYGQVKDFSVSYVPAKPDLQTSMVIGIMQGVITSIKGKWIAFDTTKSTHETKTPTDEAKAAADKLLAFDYIDSIKTLPDETVSGVSTYHYEVTVDGKKFGAIMDDVQKTSSLLSNNAVAAAVSSQVSNASTADHPVFEIWIGKKDSHLYKLALHETNLSDEATKSTANVQGAITFNSYNETMSIVAPENPMTVEELQQQVMGSLMGGAMSTSNAPSGPSSTTKTKLK